MDTNSSVPTGGVPAAQPLDLLPKRKRGRPRKMPNVAMDMVAQNVLNDIRGALGMEKAADPPKEPVTLVIEPQQEQDQEQTSSPIPSPVKRGRGRPRKHPLPTNPTDNSVPPVKRGRGRPRKVPTITEIRTEPMAGASETTDSVSAMIVAPPELMPESESGQVSITHVSTSSAPSAANPEQTYSHDTIPLVAVSIDQPEPEIPLPSMPGVIVLADQPTKKKRGRPRKNPLPIETVEKKEPQVKEKSVQTIEKIEEDMPLPAAPTVKRSPGRPKKTSLPAQVEAVPPIEEQPVKKKRGRPRKHPLPADSGEKPPHDSLKKLPQPEATGEPVIKKKRGRPRKNPIGNDSSVPAPPPPTTTQQEPPGKRKRGRPKKNTSALAAGIPAQSSEPVASSFPTVALVSPYSDKSGPVVVALNVSSDASKSGADGFQLILSSSESEPIESDKDNVANAIATLKDVPREASPLLDERFVESSDEDD